MRQTLVRKPRLTPVALVALLLAAAVLLVGGSVAVARFASQADETIHACVASNGNVRIVSEGGSCRPNESPLSWSSVGAEGPQGPQGDPGPQGPPGPQGEPSEVTVHVNLEDGGSGPAAPKDAIFLELTGVEGDSKDSAHDKWIDVDAWSWGASNSASVVGGGGGAGAPTHDLLSVSKRIDKASPKLYLNVSAGVHIPEAALEVCTVGAEPFCYLRFELEDVLIKSVSAGGSSGGQTEAISLDYKVIRWELRQQNEDGTLGPVIEGGWNRATNSSV